MRAKQQVFILFLLVFIGGVYLFQKQTQQHHDVHQGTEPKFVQLVESPIDTVRNPYAPPVRHGCETQYTQIGYLSQGYIEGSVDGSVDGSKKLMLFGKRANRDKWYYHTVVDGIKLPVEHNRRQCTVAPGCDRLSDRDQVKVDGRTYTVHMYETDQYEYNPFY